MGRDLQYAKAQSTISNGKKSLKKPLDCAGVMGEKWARSQ